MHARNWQCMTHMYLGAIKVTEALQNNDHVLKEINNKRRLHTKIVFAYQKVTLSNNIKITKPQKIKQTKGTNIL